MITTRDIKVFIFSIFITTLCLALFNQPIKEAAAQGEGRGGGVCLDHAQAAKELHNNTYDLLEAHVNGAVAKHGEMNDLLQAHINGAVAKHGEMIEKLDTLLAR